jgi:hypothetical protein
VNWRGDHPDIHFDFLGFQFRARKTMWTKSDRRIFARSFLPAASPKALTYQPGDQELGASSPQRQVPQRCGRDVQLVHLGLDQLLEPYESRGSRPVFGASEGESPSGDSSFASVLKIGFSSELPLTGEAEQGRLNGHDFSQSRKFSFKLN